MQMNEDFDLYEGLDYVSHVEEDDKEEIETDSSDDGITFLVDDDATSATGNAAKQNVSSEHFVRINPQLITKPPKYAENPNVNSFVLLSNLDWYVTQSQIYETATLMGPISYLHLFEHPVSGKFLGLSLIQYTSISDSKNALEKLPAMFSNRIKAYELDEEVYSRLSMVENLHSSGTVPGFLLEKVCNIANVNLPNKSTANNSDAEFEKIQQQLIDAGDFKSAINLFPWFQFDIFKLLRPLVTSYKEVPKRSDYVKLADITTNSSAKKIKAKGKLSARRSTSLDRREPMVESLELSRRSTKSSSRYRESRRESHFGHRDSPFAYRKERREKSSVRGNSDESRHRKSHRSRSTSRSSRHRRERRGASESYERHRRRRSRSREARDERDRKHPRERQQPARKILIERK